MTETPPAKLQSPPRFLVEPIIHRALEEDLGRAGDVTTAAVVPADTMAAAVIAARKPGRIAGLEAATLAFRLLDPDTEVNLLATDGGDTAKDAPLARISGRAATLLSGERVALNILGHMCGIATATAAMTRAIEGTKAQICCTRKTTPGLRLLEKYAVRAGGGRSHRYGLDDAILIKDNHIAAAGGVAAALNAAKANAGHMLAIEVEVDTLDQLKEALEHAPHCVLLDNMAPDMLREAVALVAGRCLTEASGMVTLERVRAIAEAGVDYISSGAITHSAPWFDIGLDFEE